jgi:hypothetical protein
MHIRRLRLFCKDPSALTLFYRQLFGEDQANPDRFAWQAGHTLIEFEKSNMAVPYHFALNISCNKIEESLTYLKSFGISPIPYREKEVVEFPNWNARSVYFFDSAGNVVEFIARRDLDNAKPGPFTPSDLLSVSEIGTPAPNLKAIYNRLAEATGISRYDGNLSTFCAAGNPEGLFILTNVDRHWFPTEVPSLPAPYLLDARIEGKA